MALDTKLIFNANINCAMKEQLEFKQGFCVNEVETIDVESVDLKKRKQVIIELYQTEVSYLLQLETIINFFIHPFNDNQLLSAPLFKLIFGNIVQLYNINVELLNAIKSNPSNISCAFATFAPFLKLYSIYAYGYKKALEILEELQSKNKKLANFVRSQESRPEVGATLISLLIVPIQRVPRYRLLLQSLLHCYPLHHPHYNEIQGALARVEEAAEHINRLINEAEEAEAIVRLSRRLGRNGDNLVIPGRKILKEGLVKKTPKNGVFTQQRYLVVFSDALLISKGSEKGPLTLVRLLPLQYVSIEAALGSSVFKVSFQEESWLFYSPVPKQGAIWIHTIEEAIRNYVECRKTLRKDISKRALGQKRLAVLARTTAAIIRRARRICSNKAKSISVNKLKRLRRDSKKCAQ